MTNKRSNAAAFLENMRQEEPETTAPRTATRTTTTERKLPIRAKPKTGSRESLKHIGGYLDIETVEKVAILRARLKLDNSELITLAVNDLYNKQKAKKAFSD
jgi:hypothetical protein